MRTLVATDLSEGADLALREGMSNASSAEDSFAVVHVVPPLSSVSTLFPQRHPIEAIGVPPHLSEVCEAVHDRVAQMSWTNAEIFVDQGVDSAEIVRRAAAWRADRIVVASQGRSSLARTLGGVATRVVRSASCDVLVTRPSPLEGPVLAATDLSAGSLQAVVVAAQEARRRSARLIVMHAVGFFEVEATYILGANSALMAPTVFEVVQSALVAAMAKLHVDAECRVRDRPAATSIIREGEFVAAQLVVVGSHGHTALARWAAGGITEKVVRGASCSVLVVKSPDAQPLASRAWGVVRRVASTTRTI